MAPKTVAAKALAWFARDGVEQASADGIMAAASRQRPPAGRARNRLLGVLWAPVERAFALLKRWCGYRRVRYRSLVKSALQRQLLALAVLLALNHSGAQTAGAGGAGGEVMTNWASDGVTETAIASGRDPVEANRVTLTVAGGPVVVQWSVSYTAHASTPLVGSGRSASVLRIQTDASLERDGLEIARWKLADQAQDVSIPPSQPWVSATASGLFVDHASGAGRRTYVLKLWNRGPRISVGMRTMVCEER
jgi:hypothetical protein